MTRDQEPGIDSARGQGFGRERQDENNQPQNDQAAQFARMMALVEAQSRQIGQLISMVTAPGASTVQSPIVAPPVRLEAVVAPSAEIAKTPATFRDLWRRYLLTLPDAEAWKRNVEYLMVPVLAHFGDKPLSDLTPVAWAEYRDEVRKPTKVSSTTRNLELRRTKACLNWATREGGMAANPLAAVTAERGRPPRETEISDDGLDRLLSNCGPLMRAFVTVLAGTGMRRDEARLLRWDEIDLTAGIISLSWKRTKTRRGREVRVSPNAMEALRGWRALQADGTPWVFPSPQTGEPYSGARVWQLFREAADVSDLKVAPGDGKATIHSLRHGVSSKLDREGAKLKSIQAILGHASPRTTLRYIHRDEKAVDDDFTLLDKPRRGPLRAPDREKDSRDADDVELPVFKGSS